MLAEKLPYYNFNSCIVKIGFSNDIFFIFFILIVYYLIWMQSNRKFYLFSISLSETYCEITKTIFSFSIRLSLWKT